MSSSITPTRSGTTVSDVAAGANAAVWTLFGISTVLVGLRLYSRYGLSKGFGGWDDAVIVVALAILLAATITLTVGIAAASHYTLQTLPHVTVLNLTAGSISVMSVCFPKIAVGLIIIRILFVNKKLHAVGIMIPSILMFMFGIVGTILPLVQCNPPAAYWNPVAHPGAKCMNPKIFVHYAEFLGAFSTLVDLIYAILPAAVIFRLNLETRRKIMVSLVMGLGIIAAAFSIYKTTLFRFLSDATQTIDGLLVDGIRAALWTIIESNILIITACLPTIAPFLRLCKKRGTEVFVSRHGTSTGRTGTAATNSIPEKSYPSKMIDSISDHELDKVMLMQPKNSSSRPSSHGNHTLVNSADSV